MMTQTPPTWFRRWETDRPPFVRPTVPAELRGLVEARPPLSARTRRWLQLPTHPAGLEDRGGAWSWHRARSARLLGDHSPAALGPQMGPLPHDLAPVTPSLRTGVQ